MDKAAALADIDSVLAARPSGDGGGSAAVAEMAALRYACICRFTAPGSAYRRQADQFQEMSTSTVTHDRTKAEMALVGVLRALRQDVDADRLRSFEELIHADMFADLLAQAEYLLSGGYLRAAAILAGATLEEQLSKMAVRNGVPTRLPNGRPATGGTLNQGLRAAGVYTNAVRAEVESWLAIRNPAAHGEPFEGIFNDAQVKNMIERVRAFVVDHPA